MPSKDKGGIEFPVEDSVLDEIVAEEIDVEPLQAKPRGLWSRLARIFLRKRVYLSALLLAGFATALHLHQQGNFSMEMFVGYLQARPLLGPAIFVAIYALFVIFSIPAIPLNLAAGMLWGIASGTALTILGAVLGGAVAFLASRYLFRTRVQSMLNGRGWQWLEREISLSGWRAVAFARVNPVFPFGPANWLFGVSSIGFWVYCWATAVFSVPPVLFVSAMGSSIGSYVLTNEAKNTMLDISIAGAALAVIILAKPFVRHLLRAAERRRGR